MVNVNAMTPLEAKLAALLVDCERLLEPSRATAQKWVIISKSQKQLQTIDDERSALNYSYARGINAIKVLPSYISAQEAFGRDRVLSDAIQIAGYWATFDRLIQYLIVNAGSMHKQSVTIDHAKALRLTRSFRETFTKTHFSFLASARVFGVVLQRKTLLLPDDLKLYRLSRVERNNRQPVITPIGGSGWGDPFYSDSSTEVQVLITVPIDKSKENSLFHCHNSAGQVASECFGKLVQALLVVSTGRIALGPINLTGGLDGMPIPQQVNREIQFAGAAKIGTADIPRLRIAYDIVSGGRGGDKTLSRALHRFILGRQRNDIVDQLVDYVIAWESILLTQDGNPITQELSYRFALNGAALLTKADRKIDRILAFRKMKSAYSTRSAIVHGGEDRERDRALQVGGFSNLGELCLFLESGFKKSIFLLASLSPNERPYRVSGGWENLIWKEKKK